MNPTRSLPLLLAVTIISASAFVAPRYPTTITQPTFAREVVTTSSSPIHYPQHKQRSSLFTSTSTSAEYEMPDESPKRRNVGESQSSSLPEEVPMSEARRQRYELEEQAKKRFVTVDALHIRRQQILGYREELNAARSQRNKRRVQQLERIVVEAQKADAEFVYMVSKERMTVAQEAGLVEEAQMWQKEAEVARSVLPQFNLDGLWVGKYSEDGFEMINVTYVGDTLVAHKVTGRKNVPKGQVTFQVDLSLDCPENAKLAPLELGERAAEQWGSRFLQRFAGQGQVAAEGHRNAQWMDGHLILVNEYFSFAWLPLAHQVFFGRPSAELTLKLLKEQQHQHTDDKAREHLEKCLEETESLEDEMEAQESIFCSHNQEEYYSQEGCFE